MNWRNYGRRQRPRKLRFDFFSGRIEDLETQLSKLKDLDKRIRIIANLEKGQETTPVAGIGGPSPSDIREKLKSMRDEEGLVRQMKTDIEHLQSEATSREESLSVFRAIYIQQLSGLGR
jgi:DNA repair ATPase RecN